MYIFDVPKDSRSLLMTRSFIYCIGFMLFMKSMEFLNPVVALIAHQTGLFTATVITRLLYRDGSERWFLILCFKFLVTDFILLQGWLTYETLPIKEDDLEKEGNKDWGYYYQLSVAMGLTSGLMLAIASKMSNVLCRPGGLYHEAYITLYAQATSVCIIPLFIVTNAKRLSHLANGESTEPTDEEKTIRFTTYMFLFVVIFAKVYFLERGTMKRFVEDYNEDLHKLPSWIGYFFG